MASTTKREKDTGRYAPMLDVACVCGHRLGQHTADRVGGHQPCLECACECFKRLKKNNRP